jgi:hypothetical protein
MSQSTSTPAPETAAPIEYNKNLKTYQAGQYNIGPFVMGNVGQHNGRTIFNLPFKTPAVKDGKNATFSVPTEWIKPGNKYDFKKGDVFLADIGDNGYVTAIRMAPIKKGITLEVNKAADQAISSNPAVQASIENLERIQEEADKITAADLVTAPADANTDDFPF